jgi:polar amino acid transport system substrate-binding protein
MIGPRTLAGLSAAVAVLFTAGCTQSNDDNEATPTASPSPTVDASSCTQDQLETLTEGVLTIATGEPAFEPWVVDDNPESRQGFEAAVAYAAAARLGFEDPDVTWVRTTFDSAVAPGPKTFDWNLQQYTITDDRRTAVDFSDPYYEAAQAVVSYEGSPIAAATTLAELQDAKLGVAVGSTSLDDAEEVIAPTTPVAVYNDNAAAVSALQNKQIDGIVIDLPSAFYLASAEIDGGVLVGQLPGTASGESDAFGILLAKDSPLTACTSWAVDQLREDGTLAELEGRWIQAEGAPVLQ